MRALITGGAGFIGSHLTAYLLKKGWEVVVVDNLSTGRKEAVPSEAELLPISVEELPPLKGDLAVDVVFHLAAEATVRCSPACWRTNVEGTKNVAERAKEANVPVVYASSAAVYGGCRPCREDMAFNPTNLYGSTKAIGELVLRGLGVEHVSLRFFNVYGEGMNPAYGAVVLAFTKAMLEGKPPVIFGKGDAVRDYIYVEDVVKAMMRAYEKIEGLKGMAVNVGTGRPTTVVELFTLLKRLTGYAGDPTFAPPRKEDVKESVADTARLHRLMPAEEFTPLEEGLRKVVEFYSRT